MLFHRRASVAVRAAVCPRYRNGSTVRIEQHLVTIKTQAALRVEWPYGPEAIDLARHQVRDNDVPVVIGAVLAKVQRDHS
jgi:hypothetical protein